MNDEIMNAHQAAVQANEAARKLEEAKEYLAPFAKQQFEITKKVLTARGLKDEYKYRSYFRKDWLEIEVEGYMLNGKFGEYPSINVQMWERGYCGDPDSVQGAFTLDELILLNKPEEFEAKLMAQFETEAQKTARKKEEEKQRQIAHLQNQLKELQA